MATWGGEGRKGMRRGEGQGENKRGRNTGRLEREKGRKRDLEIILTYLNKI